MFSTPGVGIPCLFYIFLIFRRDNVVTVRSKPSEVASAGLLRLETWTNLGTDDQNLSADRLLAVFVKVRHRRTYSPAALQD